VQRSVCSRCARASAVALRRAALRWALRGYKRGARYSADGMRVAAPAAQLTPDWDGGSRGKCKTKGKRGKGTA
jgi:hypothetical protein